MKKDKDIIAASIFCLVWEIFFMAGFVVEDVTGSKTGWYIFMLDTAIQITMLIYDAKIERLKRQLKKTRKNFSQQTTAYMEYVNKHDNPHKENLDNKKSVITISVNNHFRRDKKRKGA